MREFALRCCGRSLSLGRIISNSCAGLSPLPPLPRSTVLNLGLNDELVAKIISDADGDEGTARWVLDNYRRLLQMFGDVVRNVDMALFEAELSRVKELAGVHSDVELKSEHLRDVVEAYKGLYARETGSPFPQDPWAQLYEAVAAVFASWNNSRAVRYRQINEITGLLGEPACLPSVAWHRSCEAPVSPSCLCP